MSRPRAWVLNLDAENELASPASYRDPFAALAARPHLREALADLVQVDVVLGRGEAAPPGAAGRAFSPTPRALEALRSAGAIVPPAPDVTVLRRVADRRFGLGLGRGHTPGAIVLRNGPSGDGVSSSSGVTSGVTSAGVASRVTAAQLDEAASAIPGPRVFKRIFGFAGRGRHLSRGGAVTAAERAFVDKALREDGAVVVEPWLERTVDIAVHGFLRPGSPRPSEAKSDLVTPGSDPGSDPGAAAGTISAEKIDLVIGAPTLQETTAAGAWRATRRARPGEVTAEETALLEAQVRLAAAALAAAGYFGPFGIDAFRFVGPPEPGLVPRCEINTRYTMGWAIGMGSLRPDRDP
jgi:hypothetical protein